MNCVRVLDKPSVVGVSWNEGMVECSDEVFKLEKMSVNCVVQKILVRQVCV